MTAFLLFIALAVAGYFVWSKLPGLKGGTGEAGSKPVKPDAAPGARD